MSNFKDRTGHGVKFKHIYEFECLDKDGNVKWVEKVENLVTNAGLDEILNKFWKGSAYTAAFYVGLTDGTPTLAASDTMSSHVGWVEVAGYSEATREVLTLGSVASQSADNSASKASYSINATVTIGGAFVTTNSTKSGTTGTLIGEAALSADRAMVSGDILNVTVTLTAASA